MSKKKTQEEFEQEVYEKTNGEYIVVDKYINNRTKIWFFHIPCGHYKHVQPNHVLKNQGCKECGVRNWADTRIKTHDEFVKDLYNVFGDEYTVISEYTHSKNPIDIRHNVCGHVWTTTPNPLLKGHGCPYCAYGRSKGETRIENYLTNLHINFESQQKYDGLLGLGNGQLSYDFYLSDYNLLIEYQGEYHDGTARLQSIEEFEIQQEHDRRKRDYAKKHNIELMEIWYWDFDNIEQILESRLLIQRSA